MKEGEIFFNVPIFETYSGRIEQIMDDGKLKVAAESKDSDDEIIIATSGNKYRWNAKKKQYEIVEDETETPQNQYSRLPEELKRDLWKLWGKKLWGTK